MIYITSVFLSPVNGFRNYYNNYYYYFRDYPILETLFDSVILRYKFCGCIHTLVHVIYSYRKVNVGQKMKALLDWFIIKIIQILDRHKGSLCFTRNYYKSIALHTCNNDDCHHRTYQAWSTYQSTTYYIITTILFSFQTSSTIVRISTV